MQMFWELFQIYFSHLCSVDVNNGVFVHCFKFLLHWAKNANSHFVWVEGFIITASPSCHPNHGESFQTVHLNLLFWTTQTITNVSVIVPSYHTPGDISTLEMEVVVLLRGSAPTPPTTDLLNITVK